MCVCVSTGDHHQCSADIELELELGLEHVHQRKWIRSLCLLYKAKMSIVGISSIQIFVILAIIAYFANVN